MLIGRLQLILLLGKQFGFLGPSPFVLEQDGKSKYDVDKDYINFTCCNLGHKHRMTPRQMLNLYKNKNKIPCPVCSRNGYIDNSQLGYNNSNKANNSFEEVANNIDLIKSDNILENIKKEAINNSAKSLYKKGKPDRTIQEGEILTRLSIEEEGVAESIDYDEYINLYKKGMLDKSLINETILKEELNIDIPKNKSPTADIDNDNSIIEAETYDYDDYMSGKITKEYIEKKQMASKPGGFYEETPFGDETGNIFQNNNTQKVKENYNNILSNVSKTEKTDMLDDEEKFW